MRLEARGLSSAVEGRTLFRDLDVEVGEGEIVVVCGASGSGKTRLLRQLAWLDPLPSGRVTLDGRGPREWGVPAWRARVGYLLQGAPALPGTPAELAREVARLRARREREDPRASASRWGFAPELWQRPWSLLSVGERQRAQLALLLAGGPDVLLLDEPTSALDPDATSAVERDLAGRAALWVTHDAAQARRLSARAVEVGA